MVIVSLVISIIVVLVLVNRKINIGYSLIISGILLALLNGRNAKEILDISINTISDHNTISLAATIALITILSYFMDKFLILDRMISSLESVLRSVKFTILFAPAIIGTLLVSGGALMSCPVVKNLGDKLDLSNDKKASINMIFRHALYFIFPLSPPIILAAQLGGFSVWEFIKLQFPMSLTMYILGYILLLRGCKEPKKEKIQINQYLSSIRDFLLYSSPILVSLLGSVLLGLPFYITLIFGIMLSILINIHDKKYDDKYDTKDSYISSMYKGFKPAMVIAIIGIMLFKNVVNDIDEIYIHLYSLLEKGIPLELLIIISCIAVSFPTASTQSGVALLFPMILPLAPNHDIKLAYAMFIYTSSFMAYYASPLHLCQVLTLEYFKIKIKELFKNYYFIMPTTYAVMVIIYILKIM